MSKSSEEKNGPELNRANIEDTIINSIPINFHVSTGSSASSSTYYPYSSSSSSSSSSSNQDSIYNGCLYLTKENLEGPIVIDGNQHITGIGFPIGHLASLPVQSVENLENLFLSNVNKFSELSLAGCQLSSTVAKDDKGEIITYLPSMHGLSMADIGSAMEAGIAFGNTGAINNISLSFTRAIDKKIIYLLETIGKTQKITSLNLSYTSSTRGEIAQILDKLNQPLSLEHLNLSYQPNLSDIKVNLVSLIKKCPKLISINLENTNFSKIEIATSLIAFPVKHAILNRNYYSHPLFEQVLEQSLEPSSISINCVLSRKDLPIELFVHVKKFLDAKGIAIRELSNDRYGEPLILHYSDDTSSISTISQSDNSADISSATELSEPTNTVESSVIIAAEEEAALGGNIEDVSENPLG